MCIRDSTTECPLESPILLVTWVEAQLVGGGNFGGIFNGLDGDGDGKVEYWDGDNVGKTSDGDKRISVYNSRAEAEADGHNIPGN